MEQPLTISVKTDNFATASIYAGSKRLSNPPFFLKPTTIIPQSVSTWFLTEFDSLPLTLFCDNLSISCLDENAMNFEFYTMISPSKYPEIL